MSKSNEVMNNIKTLREQAMQADADRRQVVKGIRTVCAEITESESNGEYALSIQWTTSDGVTFNTNDSGNFAGGSMNLLCKIWNCSADEIFDKAIEESREVFFYGRPYTNMYGEPGEMQKFRRVNALDKAHATTEKLQEQEQEQKKGAK